MTEILLELDYIQLSRLIQAEANKQDINVRGYDIKIDKLVIDSENGRLRITGQIISKWNAFFDFTAIPQFINAENKLDLQDLTLQLDSTNLIFKGILKMARGTIQTRIEKILEKPLTEQMSMLKSKLDEEFSKAPLPQNLQLNAKTHHLKIKSIKALSEYLQIELEIEQRLMISFKPLENAPQLT